LNV
jgi:hypothetical protein